MFSSTVNKSSFKFIFSSLKIQGTESISGIQSYFFSKGMERLGAALQNVKLKKSEISRDFSKPKISGVLCEQEILEKRKRCCD
jgi:hypothetical protein